MHDFAEGSGNKSAAKIALALVKHYECFKIDYPNGQMKSTNNRFEACNRHLDIDLNYLEQNQILKISAAESFFFIRYLGLFVGKKVPRDNEVWELYIKLAVRPDFVRA